MIEIFAQIVIPLAALAIIAAHEQHEAELRVVEPVPSFAGGCHLGLDATAEKRPPPIH